MITKGSLLRSLLAFAIVLSWQHFFARSAFANGGWECEQGNIFASYEAFTETVNGQLMLAVTNNVNGYPHDELSEPAKRKVLRAGVVQYKSESLDLRINRNRKRDGGFRGQLRMTSTNRIFRGKYAAMSCFRQ